MPIHELVAAPLLQQDLVVHPSEDSDLVHEDSSEPPDAVPPAEDEGLAYDYAEGIKTTLFPPPSYLAVPSFTKTTNHGAPLWRKARTRSQRLDNWLFLSPRTRTPPSRPTSSRWLESEEDERK